MSVNNQESYYVGTDLKFRIAITGTGFDQALDDYEIKVVCGNRTQVITKSDIVEDAGYYYMMIDTSQFSSGLVKMVVTAKVPDDNFQSGVRREVAVQDLCYIKKTV